MTVVIVVGTLLLCTVVMAVVLRALSRRADSDTWSSGKKSTAAGLAGTLFVDGGGCGGCGGCGG